MSLRLEAQDVQTGSVDWRRDMSHDAIEKEIIGTWASVCSLANADWVGFILGEEAPCVLPAAVAQDAQLAEIMLQVTCRLRFSSLTSAMTYSRKLQVFFFLLSRATRHQPNRPLFCAT